MKYNIEKIFNLIGIKVTNISKIKTYVNSVYKIKSEEDIFFIKIYETEEEKKVAFKLSRLYPLLESKGIPVPKVIKYDETLTIIKNPYLIITKVKGKMLCEVINNMSEENKISFYYSFGKILANIHQITFKEFGESFDCKTVTSFVEANNKGPFKTWKMMHNEIINYRLSYFKDTIFNDLIRPIKEYFKKNSTLIDYEIIPRLLHIDLNQKNIFVKNNFISGIIDFDGAFVGHSEEELMRIEGANFSTQPELKKAFFKGYTELIKLDQNYEERRIFYYLSRLLVHIDCIIEFGTDYVKNIKEEEFKLKQEICKILKGNQIKFDKNSL